MTTVLPAGVRGQCTFLKTLASQNASAGVGADDNEVDVETCVRASSVHLDPADAVVDRVWLAPDADVRLDSCG